LRELLGEDLEILLRWEITCMRVRMSGIGEKMNNAIHFDLKPHVIQLLPTFYGLDLEHLIAM